MYKKDINTMSQTEDFMFEQKARRSGNLHGGGSFTFSTSTRLMFTITFMVFQCFGEVASLGPYWLVELKERNYDEEKFENLKKFIQMCFSGAGKKSEKTQQTKNSGSGDQCSLRGTEIELQGGIKNKSKVFKLAKTFQNLTNCARDPSKCPDPCIGNPCEKLIGTTEKCKKVSAMGPPHGLMEGQTWNMALTMADYKCECNITGYRWDGLNRSCVRYSVCNFEEPCVTHNTKNCTDTIENNGFRCDCLSHYEGLQCENVINVCARNRSICGDHGVCAMIDGVRGDVHYAHRCLCDKGWTNSVSNQRPNCDIHCGKNCNVAALLETYSSIKPLILLFIPCAVIMSCFLAVSVCSLCAQLQMSKNNKPTVTRLVEEQPLLPGSPAFKPDGSHPGPQQLQQPELLQSGAKSLNAEPKRNQQSTPLKPAAKDSQMTLPKPVAKDSVTAPQRVEQPKYPQPGANFPYASPQYFRQARFHQPGINALYTTPQNTQQRKLHPPGANALYSAPRYVGQSRLPRPGAYAPYTQYNGQPTFYPVGTNVSYAAPQYFGQTTFPFQGVNAQDTLPQNAVTPKFLPPGANAPDPSPQNNRNPRFSPTEANFSNPSSQNAVKPTFSPPVGNASDPSPPNAVQTTHFSPRVVASDQSPQSAAKPRISPISS